MKKIYQAPTLEIEVYQLDANIASNCAVVVTMGDIGGDVGEPACEDYFEYMGLPLIPSSSSSYSLRPHNVTFWENNCDCYSTAGDTGFFTS